MKLPSLYTLVDKSFATLIRFPLVLLAAAIGTYFSMRLPDLANADNDLREQFAQNIMTCSLALTLFLSVKVYGERKNFSNKVESILHLLATGLLIIYFVTLPPVFSVHSIVQFALFNIGLHLLVSIAPFLGVQEPHGFWQYNKALFLRFLTSALYSAVLFIGLSLALLAIEKLFEVRIDGKWYFRLWTFMAGIVNTWIFLGGIPHKFHELEATIDYPKGLKIFTQYILLPIISIYMLILYGYEIKILATSHWPVGWVSYLVIAFSIAGILSILLIWPIKENADNAWIKSYSRFFYIALFPLIAMLFIAIFKRVAAYGITENRYFIIVLAAWLTGISLYFVFSKRKNIRHIPLSLCMIAFLTSFGPWGAFSISQRSQYNRLYSVLDSNNMLKDEKVHKPEKKISLKDRKEISSIVEYLIDVHGVKSIQPLFAEKLKDEREGKAMWAYGSEQDAKDEVLDKMGVKYVSRYDYDSEESESETMIPDETNRAYTISIPSSDYTNVGGFDAYFEYYLYGSKNVKDEVSSERVYQLKGEVVKVVFYFTDQKFKVFASNAEIFSVNLKELTDKITSDSTADFSAIDPQKMTVQQNSGQYKTKVIFNKANYSEPNHEMLFHSIYATVLLKKE